MGALGYALQAQTLALEAGELPVLACYRGADGHPLLIIAAALMTPGDDPEEWSALAAAPMLPATGGDITLMPGTDWETTLSKMVFADDHPPRWVLLVGHDELLVIERAKWIRKALLRFDLPEVFGPRDEKLFRAAAALASRDSILPVDGVGFEYRAATRASRQPCRQPLSWPCPASPMGYRAAVPGRDRPRHTP